MKSIFATFLLLSASAFAGPAELASRLEGGEPASLCGAAEAALKGTLDDAWKAGRKIFVGACNANPSAAKLFPGDAGAAPKIRAYCEFRPALRLCLVCNLLTKEAADLTEAVGLCDGDFRAGEKAEFGAKVLGTPSGHPGDTP